MLAKLSRRELRYLARITFEKVCGKSVGAHHPSWVFTVRCVSAFIYSLQCVDPESRCCYFLNHHTNHTQWDKPKLLTRPDEDVVLTWTLQWKRDLTYSLSNRHGSSYTPATPYFYNSITGESSATKPDGYLLCQMCSTYLAFRRCHGPGCDGRSIGLLISYLEGYHKLKPVSQCR